MAPDEIIDNATLTRICCEIADRRLEGEIVDVAEYEARHPELAAALRERLAEIERIRKYFDRGQSSVGESTSRDELLRTHLTELRRRGATFDRYLIVRTVGKGAQGRVYEVHDKDLRRTLAMKVLDREITSVDPIALTRFLDEAQVMSQLDHPGIAPVHDIGIDPAERLFFTMKMVRGESLAALLERHFCGDTAIGTTRILNHLLQCCDAVAYAHERKVVHRDLKPDNIMVGSHGETYVMDWGLKRLLDGDAGHMSDSEARSNPGKVESLRQELARDGGSPVASLEGGIAGTLFYMSPEQARGDYSRIREQTDIYAMGAMLYELLATFKPHSDGQGPRTVGDVLRRIQNEPPTPLEAVAPKVAPELVAIVQRAMAREPEQRYASMTALATDLRNYLEGRVVTAYESGALAEARKWVARNRRFAISVATAASVIIASVVIFALVQKRHNVVLSNANTTIASEKQRVESLSDRRILEGLIAEADTLWPLHSDTIAAIQDWLLRAERLAARLPEHERNLEQFIRLARPMTPDEIDLARARSPESKARDGLLLGLQRVDFELSMPDLDAVARNAAQEKRADLLKSIAQLEQSLTPDTLTKPPARTRFDLGDVTLNWQTEQLAALVKDLEKFADPDPNIGLIARVRARIANCEEVARATIDDAAPRWMEVIRRIESGDASPYVDLRLRPQFGLVPLGPDPVTHFEEFAVYFTGHPPERDPNTALLSMRPDSAMVLVLLPGGRFRMGAAPPKSEDAVLGDHEDPTAWEGWGPVHELTLAPFFLSKYEMSQGQWHFLTEQRPSGPSQNATNQDPYPVDRVSYVDSISTLGRIGLTLPTEAQWEYAARAGTGTLWWCGNEGSALAECGNVADQSLKPYALGKNWRLELWDDGYHESAPIDAHLPNPFGLYGIIGNLWEWCLDGAGDEVGDEPLTSYQFPTEPGTGLRLYVATEKRVVRGGAHQFVAADAHSAHRQFRLPEHKASTQGLRPARSITP